MSYKINYSNIDGQEKRDKAIKDIKNYLTKNQFNTISTIAMKALNYGYFAFACSFAGVSGYPVVALWDETRQEMRDMTS